jgi:hypothetical protein
MSKSVNSTGCLRFLTIVPSIMLIATIASSLTKPATAAGYEYSTLTPVSLEELVAEADTIFIGRVLFGKQLPASEGASRVLPTRVTTFHVVQSLKGEAEAESEFQLKEFAPVSTYFKSGALVMLFLPPKSKAGFQSPGLSGYFRVTESESNSNVLVAQNLSENRGLWSNKDRLWGERFPKKIAQQSLSEKYQYSRHKIQEVLAFGDLPCKPRPIPLELLVAATRAGLSVRTSTTPGH